VVMARVDGDASAPRDASPRDLPANRLSLADAVLGIITGRPREPGAEPRELGAEPREPGASRASPAQGASPARRGE